ncbi:MAG: hypothetical protein JWM68_5004 [Verrucomicrobiales bacterium]|nr:hypothetical protein [Verrucomicrobiales bacterium]
MDWKTKAGWGFTAVLVSVMALTMSCGRSDDSKKETENQPWSLVSTNVPTNVASTTIETNFPLRSIGSLRFRMPIGWQATMQETPSNRVPAMTILFGPAKGLDFVVEFSALLGGKDLATLNTRSACEKALKQNLGAALEKKIEIQDLNGPEISGHYFSITDKNLVDQIPPPGEYKYLIQGNAKMARFATSFRIMANNPSAETREAGLEMIRTVRFVAR